MRETAAPTRALTDQAFAELLNRYQWPLFAFVDGFLHEAEMSRDHAQDVFCDAWRAAQTSTPPFTPAQDDADRRRWLYHAAYCRVVNTLRRRGRIQWRSLDAEMEAGEEFAGSVAAFEDQVIEAEALNRALDGLSPESRACLLLNVVHSFTAPEIARIVGVTTEAAKKRLTRAKQQLRTLYTEQNPVDQERMRP
ncbi:MAG TPA: sigma-70 family RNA polymerase sigma factor [Ktedonobacterales bacterium]|nr:sigma-70 family RNA polymerase sigma factor [Ktedonobacterales bacterium]